MGLKIFQNDLDQTVFSRVLNGGVLCLMGIFIFFNPFPHTTSIQEISFYLSVFLVVLGIITQKMPFSFTSPLSLPLALFTLWAGLGLFFALDPENSLHDFYAHLLKYLMLYYILINAFNSNERIKWLSWIIIISATVFCVGALGYEYIILGASENSARLGARFVHPPTNLIGVICLFAVIIAIHYLAEKGRSWKSRSLLGFCLLPLLVVTVLTQSRSNLVAMGMVAVILLSKYKKVLLVFVLLFALFVCLTPIKDRLFISGKSNIGDKWSLIHRVSMAYISYEILKDYPIVGTGFGDKTFQNRKVLDLNAYNERIPKKFRLDALGSRFLNLEGPGTVEFLFKRPHSMFSSVGVRMGLVGLVFFLYLLFSAGWLCWKTMQHGQNVFVKGWGRCMMAAFVMFLIKGSLDPIFAHVTEVVLFTILAMITIVWKLNQKEIIGFQPES